MSDIVYDPGDYGDSHRYDLQSYGTFRGDAVDVMSLAYVYVLSESPHWQDRVRAAYLLRHAKITLPDQFPCIYERGDSPSHTHQGRSVKHDVVWVASPDLAMLTLLLPEYQALWDNYTKQWGPGARRVMEVGHRDGIRAGSVYRPGTTVRDVIISTARLHSFPIPEKYR